MIFYFFYFFGIGIYNTIYVFSIFGDAAKISRILKRIIWILVEKYAINLATAVVFAYSVDSFQPLTSFSELPAHPLLSPAFKISGL